MLDMHSTVSALIILQRGRGYQTLIINDKITLNNSYKFENIVYKCIVYSAGILKSGPLLQSLALTLYTPEHANQSLEDH